MKGRLLGLAGLTIKRPLLTLITEKHSVINCLQTARIFTSQFHQKLMTVWFLSLQQCTADVKDLMLENKLNFGGEKAETIRFHPPSFGLDNPLPDSISLGPCNIQFTHKVRDLGFWLDSEAQ